MFTFFCGSEIYELKVSEDEMTLRDKGFDEEITNLVKASDVKFEVVIRGGQLDSATRL